MPSVKMEEMQFHLAYCENPFKANILKNTDNPWILAKGTKPLTLFTPLTEL